MSAVERLLAELVAIDSVSARSNVPIVERLQRELEGLGFRCRRHAWVDDAGVPKVNLLAELGPTRPGDGLAFVGHTDTVPFDPAWTEALTLTERDGKLYGRGSADTKAFIAAALVALREVRAAELRAPLAVILTADEEVGCLGAKRLAAEGLLRPRHAIIGEPTELTPIRAHKGYFLAELEVRGVEGHSAYPEVGRSAILHAGRLLGRIEALAAELERERDDRFGPPFTTVNVGLIAGGKARNVIPGHCAFPLEWRPIPGQDPETVPRLLARALEELRADDPTFDATFRVVRRDPGVATAAQAEIVRFLEQETGKASETIPFGTELPYLNALGAEGCVCGPGDIRVAHRTGEFVPRDELSRAVGIYRRAIAHFCGA